jgi:hypothetical protein
VGNADAIALEKVPIIPRCRERQDIPAYFLVRVAEGVFEERQTSVWTALLENVPNAGPVE